jgi:tRNA (guanine26-N2/guanine27-N2)-dimethyltransferase
MASDRDLGVAVVAAWAAPPMPPLRVWEMLAATGARGLRLAGETEAIGALLSTEGSPEAVAVLAANASRLRDPGRITVRAADARNGPPEAPFDYVDVDPYGTPVPFLSAALGALRDGGLLAVTATDMPVLAGAQRAACVRRYGAQPVPGALGPEGGLRVLLAHVDRQLHTAGRSLHPLVSYVLDHHVRFYAEVRRGGPAVPEAMVPNPSYPGPPLPAPGPFGPLWIGPLFDRTFVRRLAMPPTAERPRELARLLERFQGEAEIDVPFVYEPNRIARELHLAEPPSLEVLFGELQREGHRSARSHTRPSAFRTDATQAEVESAARRASDAQSQNARVRA